MYREIVQPLDSLIYYRAISKIEENFKVLPFFHFGNFPDCPRPYYMKPLCHA